MQHLPAKLCLMATFTAAVSCGSDGAAIDPTLVQVVRRGDLEVTVRERADLQAAKDVRVKSQAEGRATLIYLIPEGSFVEKGDKLAQLDVSEIEKQQAAQAIAVARAQATLEQARKSHEVVESELEAAEGTAVSRLEIAKMRREKFVGQPRAEARADHPTVGTNAEMLRRLEELLTSQAAQDPRTAQKFADLDDCVRALLGGRVELEFEMGEMANEVLQQIDEVNLAHADLEMAADVLFHSRKLQEKSFITRNELERDILSHKRQLSRVTVAWNNLQLLIKYTLRETMITLDQEIANARLGLVSVRAASGARRVRETAELDAAESEYALAEERLTNYTKQIENALVLAPEPGLVVYGRYDWDEPVYEGMSVREGQDIVVLPDIRKMVARLRVHEAQIDKVAKGQHASVKVDAFPDRVFAGVVDSVATLPEPTRRSTDRKQYLVSVMIDRDNGDGVLRPGMNALVQIEVGVFRDVLHAPLPAVKRYDDAHYVWVITPDGPVAKRVSLGRNSLTHVEVLAGLEEGEQIMMVPPDEMPAGEQPEPAREGAWDGEGNTSGN